jgi:hypothetical protein
VFSKLVAVGAVAACLSAAYDFALRSAGINDPGGPVNEPSSWMVNTVFPASLYK